MKDVQWVGSSKEDLSEFPDEVKQDMGHALFEAQRGSKALSAKPLKGFGGAGVLEIVDDFDGDTYRAVYTVKYREAVYSFALFPKEVCARHQNIAAGHGTDQATA